MVKQITEKDITIAKEYVERKTGYNGRTWEVVTFTPELNDGRVEVHIMTGSPAKGYVIVNFGSYTISAYDGTDTRIKRWRFNY